MDDTGWRGIEIVGGDGDRGAAGVVEMATGGEPRPCFACRSWEKDTRRLIKHLLARGLTMEPDGGFETPIAKEFVGRTSLKIYPTQWGFCRYECRPTQDQATCTAWTPVTSASDLADRIRRR